MYKCTNCKRVSYTTFIVDIPLCCTVCGGKMSVVPDDLKEKEEK